MIAVIGDIERGRCLISKEGIVQKSKLLQKMDNPSTFPVSESQIYLLMSKGSKSMKAQQEAEQLSCHLENAVHLTSTDPSPTEYGSTSMTSCSNTTTHPDMEPPLNGLFSPAKSTQALLQRTKRKKQQLSCTV